jgi:hypothetical protein
VRAVRGGDERKAGLYYITTREVGMGEREEELNEGENMNQNIKRII